MSSVGSEAGSEDGSASHHKDIVRTGYMKKLKTMKKKFFILRSDSPNFPACLEYYDSLKKWKNKHPAKRSIVLRNCFSVSRRTDTKHKFVIGLFTGVDCFGIVLESEEDLQEWLRLLCCHRYGEDSANNYVLKSDYVHVWKVTVQKKELASKHNLSGAYLLCLTDCTLLLAKPAVHEEQDTIIYEFTLQCIRRCGNLDTVFYIELGQASCIGAGNLWMHAEDSNIAQHMHTNIMKGCTSCPKKDFFAPKSRSRSSSATEASKPMYFGRKWPSSGDDSLCVLSHTKSLSHQEHSIMSPNSVGHSDTGRERCDSLPTRSRVTLETLPGGKCPSSASGRPCSMVHTRLVYPPSGLSHPTSPMSTTYSNGSTGSSQSVDVDLENCSEMDNVHRTIREECGEEYFLWGGIVRNIPPSSRIAAVCRNNRFSAGHHSSSNSQSSCSPCSSSPIDAGVYIPMSPIESAIDNRTRHLMNRSYDSMSHSRDSSIHEDLNDGYVSMAPLSADAGYISMDQSVHKPGDLSPGLSSCSITSMTPSDEEIISTVRPTRAYSTGSKPDAAHSKFIRCDSSEGIRTRAFSVGSKCSTNARAMARRTPNSTSVSSIEPCDDLVEMDFSHNKLRRRNLHQQQQQQQRLKQQQSLAHALPLPAHYLNRSNEGYLDMTKSSPKLETSSSDATTTTTVSPPRHTKHFIGRSPPAVNVSFGKQSYAKSSPVATSILAKVVETTDSQTPSSTGTSTTSQNSADDSYIEMKPGVCDMPTPSSKVTPVIATATNLHARKENFIVLDPTTFARTSTICATLPHIKQPLLETDGKQFRQTTTPTTPPEGYVDMSFKGRARVDSQHQSSPKPVTKMAVAEKTPEGYVDMSFKKIFRKNLVDSNFSSTKRPSDETKQYTYNSGGNTFSCSGKENFFASPRVCSAPIAIQQVKNRRSSTSNYFRRHKSEDAAAQTSTKPSFLPLSLNIPHALSFGRKKKVSCQKKDRCDLDKMEHNASAALAVSALRSSPRPGSGALVEYWGPKNVPGGVGARLHGDYHSLERVDEMANCVERDENTSEYIMMSPGVAQPPKLQRKVSEPTCMKYSDWSAILAEALASTTPNKELHRSTSVPCSDWRPSPMSSELGKAKNDVKSRSDSAMECSEGRSQQSTKAAVVDATSPKETDGEVPNSGSTSCPREKVTYVTLDMPPSEQEPSTKSEEFASSNTQSDESNLIYVQIDFVKPSGSSSPSK